VARLSITLRSVVLVVIITLIALIIQPIILNSSLAIVYNKVLGDDSPFIIRFNSAGLNLLTVIINASSTLAIYLVWVRRYGHRVNPRLIAYFLIIVMMLIIASAILYLTIANRLIIGSMVYYIEGYAMFFLNIALSIIVLGIYAVMNPSSIRGTWRSYLWLMYSSLIVGDYVMDTVTAINLHSIIGALGLIDGLVIDPLVGLLISYVIIKTGGP